MLLSELAGKPEINGSFYLAKINVYLRDHGLDEVEIKEVAGMLRGLANGIEGFNAVAGLDNDTAINDEKLKFEFREVANANRFKDCIDKYFSPEILAMLVAKRVKLKR